MNAKTIFNYGLSMINGFLSKNNDCIDAYKIRYFRETKTSIKIKLIEPSNNYNYLLFYVDFENGFILLKNWKNQLINTCKI